MEEQVKGLETTAQGGTPEEKRQARKERGTLDQRRCGREGKVGG